MTNEEIQVGEYVRTYGGYFKKIIAIIKKDNGLVYKTDNIQFIDYITKAYIKTHSFDPIDLVEAGDYVNGIRVDNINKHYFVMYDNGGDIRIPICTLKKELKTIVTKEQFKSMEYEVSGEDERSGQDV